MSYVKPLEPMLDAFCSAAQEVCEEVEAFQPDLVVVLLHSGEGPLRAALAFWEETRDVPFPPVVRTNLGREKLRRYHALCERLGRGGLLTELFESSFEGGHMLAWASEQPWQAELAAQVRMVLGAGASPARILVLDDWIGGGNTWLLSLGLLKLLFPRAESCFFAGFSSDWCGRMGQHWLLKHHPRAYQKMRVADETSRQQGNDPTYFVRDLCLLVPGTEDVDPESLAWRPITAESETLQRLSAFLPAEAWLALPAWTYATLEARVRDHAQVYLRGDRATLAQGQWQFGGPRRWFDPQGLVRYYVWRYRRITRREALALAPMSPRQATQLLKAQAEAGIFVRRGRGGGTYYELPDNCGILAYGSLLTDPGDEISWATERSIENVITPFAVEYARSSQRRAGAPTLVPVPDESGARVQAQILVIRPDMSDHIVANILYRREVNRVGVQKVVYDQQKQSQKRDPVLVETARDLAGVPYVFYTRLKPNLDFVLRDDLATEEKAERLAHLAMDSVTPETFNEGCDGIRYLSDAIAHGIQTPLTDLYKCAVLRLADNAPDLEEARLRIARQEDIVPEETR